MKKFGVSFLVVLAMCSTIVYAGNLVKKVYFSPYPILIDGEEYSSENPILQYNNRTYVALREFSEMIDVDISFENDVIIIKTPQCEEKDNQIEEEMEEEIVIKKEDASTATSNEKVVYISLNGKKYHKLSKCGNAKLTKVTLAKAIGEGYTPCLRCAN